MVDEFCRDHGVLFIGSEVRGLFGQLFVDFGSHFVVLDKDGEELKEVLIGGITNEEEGVVRTLGAAKHGLEDGDQVELCEISGMYDAEGDSLNGTVHRVRIQSAT